MMDTYPSHNLHLPHDETLNNISNTITNPSICWSHVFNDFESTSSLTIQKKNIVLLGIIPGPSEPSKDLNQYLRPFVAELLEFFREFQFLFMVIVHAKLLHALLPCDVPAGRKTCGFLSHSALLEYTKCYKVFLGGYNRR